MKIEDGFNDAPSVHETRPVRTEKTFGVGAMMTFAAVVLLAGVLGFLGGMQVNKNSSTQAMQGGFGGPGDMSTIATGTMPIPPTGASMSGQATASSSSTDGTTPSTTTTTSN